MDNSQNLRALYINACPTTEGHVSLRDAHGTRVDSMAGPRDFMVRVYTEAGYTVYDENGRQAVVVYGP